MAETGPAYGVASRPPWSVLLGAAAQHIGLGSVVLVFPVLVADAAGADAATAQAMVALSCLAMAVATWLQVARLGPVGSGFLIPAVVTAAYLPASLEAARMGGLGLVFGMTIFAGAVEIALSRLIGRLRAFLPTELSGFIVMYIGIVLGLLGFRLAAGVQAEGHPPAPHADYAVHVAAAAAVLVAGALHVWGRGAARLYCVLVGLVAAYALFRVLAPLDPESYHYAVPAEAGVTLWGAGWPLAMPRLDPALALGFAVGALAAVLRAAGDIVTSQKMTDPAWTRPDMDAIQRGALANGIGTVAAGLIGSIGVNTYSGSVGLANATGVAARRVGHAVAAMWAAIALVPGSSALVVAIPKPVLGAALFFVSTFILASGLQILGHRTLDGRKAIVVGVSLFLGLSREVFGDVWETAPEAVRLLTQSSLSVAVVSAVLLTALFRIGATQRAAMAPGAGGAAAAD